MDSGQKIIEAKDSPMQFTFDLMAFYLDAIGCDRRNDRYSILWEVFALFLAHRKGFDCSILFADITAKGNPYSDFSYLRSVSDNELLDLAQGNGDQTRIDIAKFDDVIKFICQKACSDINYILRCVEAPCFAQISGMQIIVQLRGDIKESVYLGPAEALAYVGQLVEKYSRPKESESILNPEEIATHVLQSLESSLELSPIEWLSFFSPNELIEFSRKVMTSSGKEQQAVIHEWREIGINRQSGV